MESISYVHTAASSKDSHSLRGQWRMDEEHVLPEQKVIIFLEVIEFASEVVIIDKVDTDGQAA